MKYEIRRSDEGIVLALCNDLSFADRAEFVGVLARVAEDRPAVVIADLADLRFIDSAGMGMLLTLKDEVEKGGGRVVLRHPQGGVRQALRLASFGSLFTVEGEDT